jgi:guanylate kinase
MAGQGHLLEYVEVVVQTEHYYSYSSSVRVKQLVMAGITAILTITFVGLLVVMTFVTLLQPTFRSKI